METRLLARLHSIAHPEDPGSGAHVATLPEMDGSDCSLAIGAASSAFSTFKRTTGRQRARLLRTLNDMVLSNAADLAELIVRETGKTRAEAEGEIVYAASFLEWFSGEAERTYGDVIPAANPNNRILTIKQPIGVVACLCPWNVSIMMSESETPVG